MLARSPLFHPYAPYARIGQAPPVPMPTPVSTPAPYQRKVASLRPWWPVGTRLRCFRLRGCPMSAATVQGDREITWTPLEGSRVVVGRGEDVIVDPWPSWWAGEGWWDHYTRDLSTINHLDPRFWVLDPRTGQHVFRFVPVTIPRWYRPNTRFDADARPFRIKGWISATDFERALATERRPPPILIPVEPTGDVDVIYEPTTPVLTPIERRPDVLVRRSTDPNLVVR